MYVHKTFKLKVDDNLTYQIQNIYDRINGDYSHYIEFSFSKDNEKSWERLPFNLDMFSKIKTFHYDKTWPPYDIKSFDKDDFGIYIIYQDYVDLDTEKLPFIIRGGRWKAIYNKKRETWSTKKWEIKTRK